MSNSCKIYLTNSFGTCSQYEARFRANFRKSSSSKSGYPISKLAKRIGYTRQHIYNLFSQQQIDLQLLDEIGKIINVDFSESVKA